MRRGACLGLLLVCLLMITRLSNASVHHFCRPATIMEWPPLRFALRRMTRAERGDVDAIRSIADVIRPMEKRRMVIRVPFMQNPDSEQLNRIYHTSFTEQKRKKLHDDALHRLSESFF
ncbi:hypothetical protein Q1695_011176 [Nippostrongylus brasiliensis]|nr:hypothetical protein Q1695_011176 [Nippostrongylus brasiliensis]